MPEIDITQTNEAEAVDFSAAILETVQSILLDNGEAEEDFRHLLNRVKDLVLRRQNFEATKGETRDLIAEVLFSRLQRAFSLFLGTAGVSGDGRKAAEFVLGNLLTGAALADFARVFDRAVLETAVPRDFHLAGRADFISMDDLLQLLSSGKHTGLLNVERPDSQLDIYLDKGLVAFIDPHWLMQRLFRDPSQMAGYREVSQEVIDAANAARTTEGTPIALTLLEHGYFKQADFREQHRDFELEMLYQFLADTREARFSYKACDKLPDFADRYHAGLPMMPLLLESHRRMDDWRRIRRVLPDLDEELTPAPDLFARIGDMSLGVIEIKVLTLVNNESSFRQIAETVGLGYFDLGMMIVRFANQGILEPPGGQDTLFEDLEDLEASLELAAEVLDQNREPEDSVADDLNAIFGEGDDAGGLGLGFLKPSSDGDLDD